MLIWSQQIFLSKKQCGYKKWKFWWRLWICCQSCKKLVQKSYQLKSDRKFEFLSFIIVYKSFPPITFWGELINVSHVTSISRLGALFCQKKCQHRCTLLHNLFSARSMFCLRQSYAKINDKERYSFLVKSSLPILDSFTFKILIIRNVHVIQIQIHTCLSLTEGSIFGVNLGTVRSKDLVLISDDLADSQQRHSALV